MVEQIRGENFFAAFLREQINGLEQSLFSSPGTLLVKANSFCLFVTKNTGGNALQILQGICEILSYNG